MNRSDKILLRRLSLAIVVKLVLLTALWWFFFREGGPPPDNATVSRQFLPAAADSPGKQQK